MINSFNKDNFIYYCDLLAERDSDLKQIITHHGYPPFWSRSAEFATLVYIILEQQVSLASAKAAYLKLEAALGNITPEKVLQLSDDEMKACYFSRQKIIYARHLAQTISQNELSLYHLESLPDEDVGVSLKKIKGIGSWTVDVYLMMALHRSDCFPTGDIALIKSIKEVKALPAGVSKDEILLVAEAWRPYRTIAAYLLWHAYLSKRKKA
ncbi:MAG TPA: DNA-3-methyladenine glycosylase 2 family protein [Panacibacter sp.]|nr:DNA-3-methyladenine glycosylase 2 family protein [Panacibacter sp.]HNP44656.1 DNA-3-methyladenine glycosylase 2 family protein [Panacibacter sp.]